MSQHDYDISNQAFAATRADLNLALLALASNNAGLTAPATTFAYMWWPDTTTGILKQRNGGNSDWVNILNMSTGVPVGAAASGANNDITSLTALTAGGLPNNCVLTADIANAQVTPAKLSQPLTLGTAVSTTSGVAVDFTGIPSWAKRVTVSLSGVSTNGTSNIVVRIGDSGGVSASGYLGATALGAGSTLTTTGAELTNVTAASVFHGVIVFTLLEASANKWACFGNVSRSDSALVFLLALSKSLTNPLDRISLTTVGGVNTVDVGQMNIMYEG